MLPRFYPPPQGEVSTASETHPFRKRNYPVERVWQSDQIKEEKLGLQETPCSVGSLGQRSGPVSNRLCVGVRPAPWESR